MSNRFVPTKYSEIDLEEYGGAGVMTLRPKTKMMDSKLANHILKLCKSNGLEFNDKNERMITAMFTHDITVYTLQQCVVTPDSEGQITEEEILDLPNELIERIFELIAGGEEFPLVEGSGEEMKTEL